MQHEGAVMYSFFPAFILVEISYDKAETIQVSDFAGLQHVANIIFTLLRSDCGSDGISCSQKLYNAPNSDKAGTTCHKDQFALAFCHDFGNQIKSVFLLAGL